MELKTFFLMLPVLLILISCGKEDSSSPSDSGQPPPTSETQDPLEEVDLITPGGETIHASLAYKSTDQVRGLSGVPASEFDQNDGKLFYYFTETTRTFWMPNMFFALDIFYLDHQMKIEEIVKDLPFESTDGSIPRAPAILSRHVLEMKADSSISNKLEVGDQLEWKSSLSIEETEQRMKESL